MTPTTIESRTSRPDDASTSVASKILTATCIWLISSMIVSWFEFGIFWNLPLLLFAMNLNPLDQTLVVWSLLARTLIVTSPALILLVAATKNQWHWKWKALAWSFHFTILAWIVVDCGLQCVTGANLWHYVQKAATTEDLTVGGDVSLLLSGIKSALSVLALQIGTVAIVCKLVVHKLQRSRWRSMLPGVNTAAFVAIGLAVVAVVGARHFVTQRPALEQLYGTITLRTWLFHPDRIAEYGEAAFGRECEADFQNLQADLNALFQSDVCRPTMTSARDVTAESRRSNRPFLLTRDQDEATSEFGDSRPNIILLLTESLRHDALTQQNMPRLWAAAQRGIVATDHSTNSNCSEFGAFAALYGRYAMCYEKVLDDQVPSVSMQTLNHLGYQRQMVNSCSVNFSRMNEFLSDLNFDRISIHNPKGNPWHDNDRRTLNEIAEIVTSAKQPQFVFSILMATHYSYDYPVEYDKLSPNDRSAPPQNAAHYEVLEDRYWKAVSFLDQQLSALIESVRNTNTIVIVTGDHGESFLDDGFLCHGTRLSKIQTSTPLLIVGAGITSGTISEPTGHIDLMPTILDLATHNQPSQRRENNTADLATVEPRISTPTATGPGRSLLKLNSDHLGNPVNADPHRSQLIVQARVNDWEIGLQHPEGMLAFQTSRFGADLKITGFLNDKGRIDPSQRRLPEEIAEWNERLMQALTAGASGGSQKLRIAADTR